jgi:DNA-binding response OmpR family regulator
VRGIDAGADDFLTKPFVIAELKARVRSLTRLKRYTDKLDSADAVIYRQREAESLVEEFVAITSRPSSDQSVLPSFNSLHACDLWRD